jgi:hypothetical protein
VHAAYTRVLYSTQLILPVQPRITNAGGGNWFRPSFGTRASTLQSTAATLLLLST